MSTPTNLSTVLIANRGEIAVRVIRAVREAGLRSIAVYADADIDALHTRLADEAYALGGTTPAESYLDQRKILDIAARSGADAVHPGYGFLSESADFARAVTGAGLTWIGPDPDTIEVLGDKASARALARCVGAPLVPGTDEPVADAEEVIAFAEAHGLPIAIKAVHGGGGRGMRVVHRGPEDGRDPEDSRDRITSLDRDRIAGRDRERIAEAYESAVREAEAAFGRGDCLVERFLERPRHIEAQVLGDRHGRIAVLGTRDCSLQRRNQKLVEEAPAPFLDDELRERIHRAAADICAAARYVGAGTVEFLLGADGTLTFLEVNTRLQVEHPVTEAVTGVDLVREQLRIAAGAPMTVPEQTPVFGHAIEFRINAEDPALGFLPTPGTVEVFNAPGGPGVRLDSGVAAGQMVPGTFDSLLAKLIVWGRDRDEAIARSRRALSEFEIGGVATVLPFDRYVVTDPAFTAENGEFGVHTRWIEEECDADFAAHDPIAAPADPELLRFPVEIEGRRVEVGLPGALLERLGGGATGASGGDAGSEPSPGPDTVPSAELASGAGAVLAPFAARLTAWKTEDGSEVEEGQTIAILEAMKMEVPVRSPRAGTLKHRVEAGEDVTARALIGTVESDSIAAAQSRLAG
ncbi:MAG: acetyl/propionyl/methylcrotonyl-CoA carboxylase subunit alpha [Leucobacter sp.]